MARKSTTSYLKLAFISTGAIVAFSLLFVFLLNPYNIEATHAKKPVILLGNYLNDNILRLHVDKNPEWMKRRLHHRDYIRFVSCFYNMDIAEESIQAVLEDQRERVEAWVRDQTITKNMRKSFRQHFKAPVGFGIYKQNEQEFEELHDVKVVIQKVNNNSFKIITAYPIPRKR